MEAGGWFEITSVVGPIMGLAGKCKRPEMRFRKNHYHFYYLKGCPNITRFMGIVGPHLNFKEISN